jgi:tetratricopeptide (TPR) repeat protein
MSLRLLLAGLTLASAVHAATPLEEAISLYKEKKYPDARAAFEKIATTEPTNAAACYYLGMTLTRRGDDKAQQDALPWLEKAANLEPNNPTYLADYAGVSMLVADKTMSLTAATNGRDAMERSLVLDPENIEARVGLWRFYSEAPLWLGDKKKAAAELSEIRKRNPDRADLLLIDSAIKAKKFNDAFNLCDERLGQNPEDSFALFQYGRVAIASGQNLDRALANLKKYLALAEIAPSKANPALGWLRLGNLHEKLGQADDARAAYQAALRLKPDDSAAATALANLK